MRAHKLRAHQHRPSTTTNNGVDHTGIAPAKGAIAGTFHCCLPVLRPLRPADVAQPLRVHHESRRVGPAGQDGALMMGIPRRASLFRSASSAACMVRRAAGRRRSILGTVSLLRSIMVIVCGRVARGPARGSRELQHGAQ